MSERNINAREIPDEYKDYVKDDMFEGENLNGFLKVIVVLLLISVLLMLLNN